MKKKIFITIIIIVFFLIILFIFFNTTIEKNNNENTIKNEIQPEEEISEEQNYDTKIKIYALDPTSNILTSEEITIDARNLIDNPYKYIVELLINLPENSTLKSAIPSDTKINSIYFNKEILTIDLNEAFLNSSGTDAIYSIVDTLCEFNDVDGVQFLINGKTNEQLSECFVKK